MSVSVCQCTNNAAVHPPCRSSHHCRHTARYAVYTCYRQNTGTPGNYNLSAPEWGSSLRRSRPADKLVSTNKQTSTHTSTDTPTSANINTHLSTHGYQHTLIHIYNTPISTYIHTHLNTQGQASTHIHKHTS